MRTAYFHPRRRSGESIETFGALFHLVALLLLFMLSFRLFLQAPLPVIVRHTKPCIVANVVDYDGSFVRSVPHTSHSLLNVKSKALGGAQEYGTLAVGDVKAL